jgi:pimeloyl-ACP methyl ester carboxylesterase
MTRGRCGVVRAKLAIFNMDVYLEPLTVRTYGEAGSTIVVLHGGPGAPGSIAPVARTLGAFFRALEPLQRTSDDGQLTVQRHIDDLHDVLVDCGSSSPPALVGHSWGAMLALACAAQHPGLVGPIALVGCGTFDATSRSVLQSTVNARATSEFNAKVTQVIRGITDPDVRLCVLSRLLDPLYTYDGLPEEDETEDYDSRGHDQTWNDMLRLQQNGTYPGAFVTITTPVLMLHGAWDPHPGRTTYETLSAFLPQLQYVELRDCGHYPWRERCARDAFYSTLTRWLGVHLT